MNEQAAAIAIEGMRVRIARQMREPHRASRHSAKFFVCDTREVRIVCVGECHLNDI
jgi:hypothetical protein